ncbi:hypothetical protein BLNAU_8419 [Blattamonas nauphoetae]|uniref:eRF1 domain-containing protein n=1 Tax=Blattamonas nauphoetae TaxID=2049346 RepID=A0ABQ9XYM2_9EUKA|nr:hypothetical protein BLNAU_8419 [Blattamonas nauphoetae]
MDGVELAVEDSEPLSDWLVLNHTHFGCTLHTVTDRSQEGSQFCRGFGGIGGLLRFNVDVGGLNEQLGVCEEDEDESSFLSSGEYFVESEDEDAFDAESMIVNTPNWNEIPLLIRDWDGKDEASMCRLLDEMSRILTILSDSDLPLTNKRHLLSTLSTFSQTPDQSKKVHTRVRQCITLLESVQDGPLMVVDTDEFRTMEESLSTLKQRTVELMKHNKALTDRVAQAEEEKRIAEEKMRSAEEGKRIAEERQRQAEEQKGQALRDKDNLTSEVILMKQECEEARKEKVKSETEIQRLMGIVEEQKQQLTDVPIWVGTESLQTLDRTAHTLTPTTLTQIIVTPKENLWRTAFTQPIDEGEWEFKIRARDNNFVNVRLGFIRHPLPEDATQHPCGYYHSGIGGDFYLWDGKMWKSGKEFKPVGTNKKCDRIGQTSAIRVIMWRREARLFVDDEEQPGIFSDIPSPLCLGITTGFTIENLSVEMLWLKRLRGNEELERADVEERRTLKSENDILKHQLADVPIWVGTESLQTLDRTAHTLTPTTLTQIIVTPKENLWRTAFTQPIDEGEWEFKIRARDNNFVNVRLGFIRHPLPEDATQHPCGYYHSGIGGDFYLWDGKMWKSGKEFKPVGTNKKCDRIGQTSAIRVIMWRREARLFVDDEEQPGIFSDIPSPLCLGITTGFTIENLSVEMLWLKRLRA